MVGSGYMFIGPFVRLSALIVILIPTLIRM